MKKAIGIDTGGTFTDGVLIDVETKKILHTVKTPTTHENLQICIENILSKLDITKNDDIKLISLSTTLSTNACVEKKFCRCGLILFGSSPQEITKYGPATGLKTPSDIYFARGCLDSDGNLIESPDWNHFREFVADWQEDFACFAIVAKWGMKNQTLEINAKKILSQFCDKPIVCGHELSSDLNYLRRAVSAYINAQLTPIFAEFIDNVKASLNKVGIDPAVTFVRGDGTLMSESYARKKPIQTLLSGPVASVLGALALLPETKSAVVIDLGGTTSDVAIVEDGMVRISANGACIGDFYTATKAMEISTVLLGGDTEIMVDNNGHINLGQSRAIPLAVAAANNPTIQQHFAALDSDDPSHPGDDFIFYCLNKEQSLIPWASLTLTEQDALKFIAEQPRSLNELRKGFGHISTLLDRLAKRDYIIRSTLTPTDIMHVSGDYIAYDRITSIKVVTYYANKCGCTIEEFCDRIYKIITQKLYMLTVKKLMRTIPMLKTVVNTDALDQLLRFSSDFDLDCLNIHWKSAYRLIGIGAPSDVFVPRIRNLLNIDCIVPPYAEVGNAIGAILGKIRTNHEVKIYEIDDNTFEVLDNSGKIAVLPTMNAAEKAAEDTARRTALRVFYDQGGRNADIKIKREAPSWLPFQSNLKAIYYASASCDVLNIVK